MLPLRIAKWLGLAYLLGLSVYEFSNVDAPDVFLLSFIFVPWIVGPAGLAAVGSKISRTAFGSWIFLTLEAAIIASTAFGWYYLIVIVPDAQNGIAMAIFLPFYQYVAVFAFGIVAILLGWRRAKSR